MYSSCVNHNMGYFDNFFLLLQKPQVSELKGHIVALFDKKINPVSVWDPRKLENIIECVFKTDKQSHGFLQF